MRYPRILFYAINGLGLGHVTRLLAIARKLRGLMPDAEIVFFTSSEAEDVIFREGFAAFKVPSKTLRAQAHLRPATYARMLQTVTLNLMASFHPHVLVVDTFPAGTLKELLPVLRWDSRKVFVFRVQRAEAAASPLMQATLELYDLVLVPHHPGEVDVPVPESVPSRWTGPILIRDRADALPRDEARARLDLPADVPVVYVTFGGGGDQAMDTALQLAVEALGVRHAQPPGEPIHLAVPYAPLYRGSMPGSSHGLSNVTVVRHYPMAEMMAAFDAAISAAGYNTSMELLHHGVPTALVPFPRQVDDQAARATDLSRSGAAIMIGDLTADAIRQAVRELLDPIRAGALRQCAMDRVPANGADVAAQAIRDMLGNVAATADAAAQSPIPTEPQG
jgi:predicted glycosyltransferase